MSKRILLIGAGQIGSRHLQAMATLKDVDEIFVVDPKPESLQLSQSRLKEVTDRNPRIQFHWLSAVNELVAGGDLCLVTTYAAGRCSLVKNIAQQYGYKNFLIEKVVARSTEEYRDLISFSKTQGLRVWVNCQMRTFGIHRYIKSRIASDEPIVLTVIGGNYGLACNGVHQADLFLYYTGADRIIPTAQRIDPALQPSKRGAGIFDLSGTMYGFTQGGSDFILSYTGTHRNNDMMTITSKSGHFVVDALGQFAYECLSSQEWKPILIQESFLVSQTSRNFISDIIKKGKCALPSLEDCLPAHQYILDTLLPHFNKLLNQQNDYCPVT